jgi:hypothetical protein
LIYSADSPNVLAIWYWDWGMYNRCVSLFLASWNFMSINRSHIVIYFVKLSINLICMKKRASWLGGFGGSDGCTKKKFNGMHLEYSASCLFENTTHWKCRSFLTSSIFTVGTILSRSCFQMIYLNHVHQKIWWSSPILYLLFIF